MNKPILNPSPREGLLKVSMLVPRQAGLRDGEPAFPVGRDLEEAFQAIKAATAN